MKMVEADILRAVLGLFHDKHLINRDRKIIDDARKALGEEI